MPASLPTFLQDPMTEAARLAVFGKHPAAADHLEDIGLTSASLVAFKQGFYIEGIGGSLARQTWCKELPSPDVIPYDHELLCVGHTGWLAARFKHSSDASGRRQYPLVVAVHGAEHAALQHATALLDELDACTESFAALRDTAALRQAQAQAQQQWQSKVAAWNADIVISRTIKEDWLRAEALGPDLQGLQRICHALHPAGAGAGKARVPLVGVDQGLSRALWLSFASLFLEHEPAVLTLITPHSGGYGDLFIGPPASRALAGLFAGLSAQPLTSAVPFNLSPDWSSAVRAATDAWLEQAELFAPPDARAGENKSSGVLQRICSGFRSWLKS